MNSNVNWSIAKVHLLSKKRQTVVAILGVTFGISMFILMISFMNGTNEFLQDAMLSSTPDVRIYNETKTDYSSSITDEYFKNDSKRIVIVHHQKPKNTSSYLKNIYAIVNDIKQNKEVVSVSPVLSTQVFFNYGPARLNGIISGIDIHEEKKILNISGKMIEGRAENLIASGNGILLGQRLAENLNVHIGDLVTVTTAMGKIVLFRLVGIFQFGLGSVDNTTAMTNIPNVQQLLAKGKDYFTDIHIKLADITHSKRLAGLFANKSGYKAD